MKKKNEHYLSSLRLGFFLLSYLALTLCSPIDGAARIHFFLLLVSGFIPLFLTP